MDPALDAPLRRVLAGPDHPAIVAAEAALRAAQLAADVAALDALIAEDLLFAGPDGRLAGKAEDLAAHRGGLVVFLAHDPEELRIRRLGPDAAVASLRAALRVRVAGRVQAGVYRYTRVWQRLDGAWRVVAGQVAAVAG